MRFHTDRKYDANDEGVFRWELPTDSSSSVVLFPTRGEGVMIAVSEEHAMDSYNQEFECSIHLPEEQAKRLRDLLNQWLPTTTPK